MDDGIKRYYVQLPGYQQGEIWDEDKYNRNKEQLFNEHKDAVVMETAPLAQDEAIGDNDMFTVHLPGFPEAEAWDAQKLARNREQLMKEHPDAEIVRAKPVDYWGDRLNAINAEISQLKPQQESALAAVNDPAINMRTSFDDLDTGSVVDAARRSQQATSDLYDVQSRLDALYRQREENPAFQSQKQAKLAKMDEATGRIDEMFGQLNSTNPQSAKLMKSGDDRLHGGAQLAADMMDNPGYYRDYEALAAAKMFYDDARKKELAPSKYDDTTGFGNFFRGLVGEAPETLSPVALGKSIAKNVPLSGVIKAIQDAEGKNANIVELVTQHPERLSYLSPAQKELITAFVVKSATDWARAEDLSLGYQSGSTAMQSLGFMADFFLMGGLGDAAAKGATGWLTKGLAKASMEMGLKGGARELALAAPKFLEGTIQAAVKTAVMTPFMPSSYANLFDNLTKINDAGQVDMSGKAIRNAIGDVFIENLSESAGAQVEAILGVPFKMIGKTGLPDLFANTKFGAWGKAVKNAPITKILTQAGFNGYIGEIGEEWYGNALRVMTGVDKNALKDFATVDQQIVTLTSFAPMTLFGGATSTAQYLASKKQMAEAGKILSSVLEKNGYDQQTIQNFLDVTQAENPTQLADKLAPVIVQAANDNADAPAVYKAVMDYAQAVARYRTLDGVSNADIEQQRQGMLDEITAQVGGFQPKDDAESLQAPWIRQRYLDALDADGERILVQSVRTLTDNDGNELFVVGEQDDMLATVNRNTGENKFVNQSAIEDGTYTDSGAMSLNDFLDRELVRKRQADDRQRMELEQLQNQNELMKRAQPGTEVNLGTVENPMQGTIVQFSGGKFIVQGADGSIREFDQQEMANILELPLNPVSQEQQEAADADELVRRDNLRDRANTMVGRNIAPILGREGDLELVQVHRAVENVNGLRYQVDYMDNGTMMMDFFTEDQLNALVGMSEQTPAVDVAEQTEQVAPAPADDTPRDFRGNPLPMRTNKKTGQQTVDQNALWNKDPEAWARWNDTNPNQRVTSKERLEYTLTELNKEIEKDTKAVQKAALKGIDEDEMDNMEAALGAKLDRRELLQSILNKYNLPAEAGATIAGEQRKAAAEQVKREQLAGFPGIQQKWNDTPKAIGAPDEIRLPNGETVTGKYVLTEATAPTASHNPANGFAMTDGFTVDENGKTVNDRDYESDKDAQNSVLDKAANYDQRALQTPVIVSADGVVLSGNDRTMASQIAAANNTDGAYLDYLNKYPQKYGFTAEQVKQFAHPRVVFVPDAAMPYNAATFAKFNAEEKKSQSKTEKAVKAGKTLNAESLGALASLVDRYDDINALYNSKDGVNELLNILLSAEVISQEQVAALRDGDTLSGTGMDLLESTLIGAALDEEAVRIAMSDKSIRKSVVSAISQILVGNTLNDYNLRTELTDAITLVANGKALGEIKFGESVQDYIRQQHLFMDDVVAEASVQLLADAINDRKTSFLKKVLSLYNRDAVDAANGQMNLLTGDVLGREAILRNILEYLGYDTRIIYDTSERAAEQRGPAEPAEPAGPVAPAETGQAPAAVQGGEGSEVTANGYGPVIKTYETKRGTVEVRTKVSEKDGVRKTSVVAIRNGNEVGTRDFVPLPSGYRIANEQLPDGTEVVGLKELRESTDGSGKTAATLIVKYDGVIDQAEVVLERTDTQPSNAQYDREEVAAILEQGNVGEYNLADYMTDEEVAEFMRRWEAFLPSNDALGEAYNRLDADLHSSDKKKKKAAQAEIDRLEQAQIEAHAPVQEYVDSLIEKYGQPEAEEGEEEPIDEDYPEGGDVDEIPEVDEDEGDEEPEPPKGKKGKKGKAGKKNEEKPKSVFTGKHSDAELATVNYTQDEWDQLVYGGSMFSDYTSKKTGEKIEIVYSDDQHPIYHDHQIRFWIWQKGAEYGDRRESVTTTDYMLRYLKLNGFKQDKPSAKKNKYGYWVNTHGVIVNPIRIELPSTHKGWANMNYVSFAQNDKGKWTTGASFHTATGGYSGPVSGGNNREGFDTKTEAIKYLIQSAEKYLNANYKGGKSKTYEQRDLENLINTLKTKTLPQAMLEEGVVETVMRVDLADAGGEAVQGDLFGGEIVEEPVAEAPAVKVRTKKESKGKKKSAKPAKQAGVNLFGEEIVEEPDEAPADTSEDNEPRFQIEDEEGTPGNFHWVEERVCTNPQILTIPGAERLGSVPKVALAEKNGKWYAATYVVADGGNGSAWGSEIPTFKSQYIPYNSRKEAIQKAVEYMRYLLDEKARKVAPYGETFNETKHLIDYLVKMELPKEDEKKRETAEDALGFIKKALDNFAQNGNYARVVRTIEAYQDFFGDDVAEEIDTILNGLRANGISKESKDEMVLRVAELYNRLVNPEAEIEVETTEEPAAPAKDEKPAAPAYGSQNKMVTTEKYEELKKQMLNKLGQLNAGFDPETFFIGAQMAVYHVEAGARKFVDFAQRMIKDLGDAIRPYLKAIYNGARDLPGMEELRKEMDSAADVDKIDVGTISVQTEADNAQGPEARAYAGENTVIQGMDGISTLDVFSIIEDHIDKVMGGAVTQGFNGFSLVDMIPIGSRAFGMAREDSDLDILLEYEGDAKEDSVFNVLNGEPLEILGIKVDFFPIRAQESGTMEEWLASHNNGRPVEKETKKSAPVVQQVDVNALFGAVNDMYRGKRNEVKLSDFASEIKEARKDTDTNPSDAQKEAGNYKKGHISIDGYDISLENPKGSVRSGKDANGNEWSVTMNNDYGYIRMTEGVDGDHIDVFLSDNPTQGNVFVVDQVKEDGSFDEHKVMYGFESADEASKAYLANYSPGWKGLGAITEVTKDEFKKWVDSSHRKTKPFADYKSVNPVEGESLAEKWANEYFGEGLLNKDLSDEDKQKAISIFNALWNENGHGGKYIDGKRARNFVADEYGVSDDYQRFLRRFNDNLLFVNEQDVYELNINYAPAGGRSHLVAHRYYVVDWEAQRRMDEMIIKGSPRYYFEQGSSESPKDIPNNEETPEVNEAAVTGQTVGELGKYTHTKTGKEMSIVRLTGDRVSADEFKRLKARAKELGGYYSSYGGAKGFLFDNEADAIKFNTINAPENAEEQTDVETAADTTALVSEAASVAVEAESLAENEAPGEQEAAELIERIDTALDAINDQLALLGFYEADTTDQKSFNESYGYMKSAEKKAVKDADKLAKRLADDLGINVGRKKLAVANIAPAGGDVTFRLPLDGGMELYVDITLEPDGYGGGSYSDNLRVGSRLAGMHMAIMFRVENPAVSGHAQYVTSNSFAPNNVKYADLLRRIRSVAKDYLPKAPATAEQEGPVDVLQVAKEQAEKSRKSAKKSVSSQEEGDAALGDLFATLNDAEEPAPVEEVNTDAPAASVKPTEVNGYKIGEKVQYRPSQGDRAPQTATIYDFEYDGRPVLDTGLAPVLYEVVDWEQVSKIEQEPVNETDNASSSEQPQGVPAGAGSQGEEAGQENAGSDRGGEGGRERDLHGRSRSLRPRYDDSVKRNTRNNRVAKGEVVYPKTPSARFKANIAAIRLLKELQDSGKDATKEQMAVLRQYTGWGGLGGYFNNEYSAEHRELKSLLTDEEMAAAALSINTAYYTPVEVIDNMWEVAKRLGFEGGNILEGSAGTGAILASMPKAISERSAITAVELDNITGGILRLLYPDATVHVQGFQETDIDNGSIDLAITNVPFGDINVYDSKEKDITRKFGGKIHDFCIAKNIRKLAPGGLGIFISTRGTLDNGSKTLRQWIVNEGDADVIGAFRLNNETFEGTGATSDIIVVRKRVNGNVSPNAIDVTDTQITRREDYELSKTEWNPKTRSYERIQGKAAMEINSYFVEHPENMGGEMGFGFEHKDEYRPGSSALWPSEKIDQNKRLAKWAKQFSSMKAEEQAVRTEAEPAVVEDSNATKEGQLVTNSKGEICISRSGKAIPLGLNAKKVKGYSKAQVLSDYDALKKAINEVLDYELKNESDDGLKPILAKLNRAYDTFAHRYSRLNQNSAISFLRNDVDFPAIAAVEDYKEKKSIDGKVKIEVKKTSIFSGRVLGAKRVPTPKDAKDGVIVSMNQFGRIDVPFIADALHKDEDAVRQEILDSGLGFENPLTGGIEVEYEYLSGNVREKLEYAREHNTDGKYDKNISALEKVVPADIPAHLIEFSLGSDWMPVELYTDFAKEKFDVNDNFKPFMLGGSWAISDNEWDMNIRTEKNRAAGVHSEVLRTDKYGHELMIAAMNNSTVSFSRSYKDPVTGQTITESDKEATQAATQKMSEMRDDFKEWARAKMLDDPDLAQRVAKVYNDTFNAIVPKEIKSTFLPEHFEGMATKLNNGKELHLREHQAKAVIRGTTEPLMLAHEVGTGKTFTLIATAMEMRRLGTAKKPMIVVQNSTLGQFVSSAKELYPNAKVLTLSEEDKTKAGRTAFYAKIKYNDWDMIIVPQSVFEMIPDSEERQRAFIQEKIEEKEFILEQAKQANNSSAERQLKKELEDLQYEYQYGEKPPKKGKKDAKKEAEAKANAVAKAKKQLDRRTDDVSDFDDMGIDALLVDEAHAYKHLGFSTAMQRGVKGVDSTGSKKSAGVYLKTRAVFDKAGWKNVIFATGTPISNTAAEIWTFMKYLMPEDKMRQNHIYYFDDFVRNFGNIAQSLEFTTSGKFKENTRFASYTNLPELIRIWWSVCDTVRSEDAVAEGGVKLEDKQPKMENWTGSDGREHVNQARDIYLPQSGSLMDIMNAVRSKLEWYENLSGKEKKEYSHIPVVMFGVAQMAAIDPRLVDREAPDEPNSKTNKVVEETLRALKDSERYNGTCAIFCDKYQRTDLIDGKKVVGFNIYSEIKSKLVAAGVPEGQIAIMKSTMTTEAKEKIFAKVNAGEIRVILGSSATLGTGVNIQERLFFVAHVDAPPRPMDYTQRNGRILRQGNLHRDWGIPVRVVRFGVEDSLDVTAYQRLSTKSKFIDSVMDGKPLLSNGMDNRVLEEAEEGEFDNPVAVLSGSQYALLKSQAERELRKLRNKKEQYRQDQIYIDRTLKENDLRIAYDKQLIDEASKHLATVKRAFPDGKVKEILIEGKKVNGLGEVGEIVKEKITGPLRELVERRRNDRGFTTEDKVYKMKFDGYAVDVEVSIERTMQWNEKTFENKPVMSTRVSYSCKPLGIVSRWFFGGMNGIKDIPQEFINEFASGRYFEQGIMNLENTIARLNSDNDLMLQRRGKPFAEEEKLQKQEEIVKDYTEKMKAEMAEKEKKYADMAKNASGSFNLDDVEVDEDEDGEGEGETHNSEVGENAPKLNMNDPTVVAEAVSAVNRVARRLGLRVVFDNQLGSKGAYTEGTDFVRINLANCESVDDAVETLLHEGVAHFGLREMLGEQGMREFIDDILTKAAPSIRRKIQRLADENGWSMEYAAEEYVAELAQKTDYTKAERSLWRRILDAVRNLISSITGRDTYITDDTIREMLVASYARLEEQAADTFDNSLQRQIDGTLPEGYVHKLGLPGEILRSVGVPNLPITVTAHRLATKANRHGYTLDELKGLTSAINNPIAVFAYGKGEGVARNIVVEIEHNGKNFVVGMFLNPSVNEQRLEINNIRTVYPKDTDEWVRWIKYGRAKYLDKEKIKAIIAERRMTFADVSGDDLIDIANIIDSFENPNTSGEFVDGVTHYRKVTDKALLSKLENGPTETGYRNVAMNADGSFGSPMAGKLGKRGGKSVSTSSFALNEWEMAEENPDMATEDGKINLIKPQGRGNVDGVDYNPYIHIRPTMLNRQFTQAWKRPELVYVETSYPSGELSSGYHAEKAKLSVGRHPWNGGELILSRYDKPMRIVPWDEVAEDWVAEYANTGVTFDIVPPELLPILAQRGVEILPPKKAAGADALRAYNEWSDNNPSGPGSGRKIASDLYDRYENQNGEDKPWLSEYEFLDMVERELPRNAETKPLLDMIDQYRSLAEEDFAEGRRDFSGGEMEDIFNDFLSMLQGYADGTPVRNRAAWHGSGAAFDRFREDMIGTGEGVQAHGYGHYVSLTEDTARRYAGSIGNYDVREAGRVYWKIRDIEDEMEWAKTSDERREELKKEKLILQNLENILLSRFRPKNINSNSKLTLEESWVILDAVSTINRWGDVATAIEHSKSYLTPENAATASYEMAKYLTGTKVEDWETNRNLYRIDIPEDDGVNYLDENKELSKEQRGIIANALRNLPEDSWKVSQDEADLFGDMTANRLANSLSKRLLNGYEMYAELTHGLGSKKAASEFLSGAGFVGIKYDGRIDGPCAVIFRDEDVHIVSSEMFRKGISAEQSSVSYNESTGAKRLAASETARKFGVEIEFRPSSEMRFNGKPLAGRWMNGKMYICPEHCRDNDDAVRTVLHEGVGHNGLRRLIGDENMREFCLDLFRSLPKTVRNKIASDAVTKYGGNVVESVERFAANDVIREVGKEAMFESTEEWLAETSETIDYDNYRRNVWDIIRDALRRVLAKVGINVPLSMRDVKWLMVQSAVANHETDPLLEARRQVVANALGFTLRQQAEKAEAVQLARNRIAEQHLAEAARIYNKDVLYWFNRLHETWVDKDNAVHQLVKAIEKATGKAAKAFEDIRLSLNQQSSKGLAAIEKFERECWNPMQEAIRTLMDEKGIDLHAVERYVMIKHGLERNEVFAKRDAREFYQDAHDTAVSAIENSDKIDDFTKKALIAKEDAKLTKHLDAVNAGSDVKYLELRKQDYGGLTAMYSEYDPIEPFMEGVESEEEYQARVLQSRHPKYTYIDEAGREQVDMAATEEAAQQEVNEFENGYDDAVKELWKRINAATKFTLKHQYDANMMSRDQYQAVSGMFKYYVPLRGFADNTAEDMYDYYQSDQRNDFTPPLLKAKGRKTEAESPFGYIGSMASSGIAADMKNETKLALYYFVSNRAKNDLVTISEVWYKNTGVDEFGHRIFTPVYPPFNEDLSSEEAKRAYEDWEKQMQEEAKAGFAFKGGKKLNLKNSVIHIDERQKTSHVIKFKVGGRDLMMYINGNPRAAQAINNELNVEMSTDYQKVFGKVLRWFSGINTSYNPEFWLSNAQRDILFALMSVNVKEDPEYNAAFRKNLGQLVKATLTPGKKGGAYSLKKKLDDGKLGDERLDRLYQEFVENGGVTGYTTLKNNEEWELELRKFTGDQKKAMQAVKTVFEKVQNFGEAIEQMTRFAAYTTSREQGKEIKDAVNDAKELTVNFNRKGSGKAISFKEAARLRTKDGKKLTALQKAFVVGASWLPVYGRRFIMFFNASTQGLNAMYKLYKKNGKHMAMWTAGYLALGVMQAAIHALLDDDDDYLDIPDYERRNNLLLGGGGVYFKWAIPQEARVFYAIGDMAVNHALGREPNKDSFGGWAGEIASVLSDIAPLNPTGGLSALAPSALTPIVEVAMNRDYKGAKIFNDLRYLSDEERKRTPAYQRAYQGTGKVYVLLSQSLNWMTGGDYADAGWINPVNNPAAWEHILQGATGGAGTTIGKFYRGTIGQVLGEDFTVRNTPFLSRLLTVTDDRYRNAHTTELFDYYKAEAEHTKKLINTYRKNGDDKKLDRLYESEDYEIMTIYDSYKSQFNYYNDELKATTDKKDRKALMREQDAVRKEMIMEISNIGKND